VIDILLCDRFGWTLTELDEQDEARLLPAIGAANIGDALRRVLGWREAAGNGQKVTLPTAHDLAIWGDVERMLRETE
jgi:hypothetical protein